MRVSVTLMDDEGKTYGGVASLQVVEAAPVTMGSYESAPNEGPSVNLDLPVRPFMKRYGANKGGPQRFVLLLAHMTHGTLATPIQVSAVQKLWNTMSGLMDGKYFNSAYPTRARDSGWVDTTKSGEYVLLPAWTEIL